MLEATTLPNSSPLSGASRLERLVGHASLTAALFEAESLGMTLHEGGRILEANDTFLAMVGRSRAELEAGGLSWAALTPPEYAAADAECLRQLRETGRAAAYEKEYQRPDGSRVPVRIASLLLDPATLRRVVIVSDLSEQRAAAAALRESEARFHGLAESMPQIAWICDAAGRPEFHNRRWQEVTGLPPGQGWPEVLHPEDRDRVLAAWRQAIASGTPYETEHRLRCADGGWRWFLARALPQRDAAGRVSRWFGTATDIEEAVRARQALARSNAGLETLVRSRTAALEALAQQQAEALAQREVQQAALVQAQKLEALGQLVGGVAHDFNNLLMAISGSYHLLERRLREDPSLLDLVRQGQAAAGRANGLVRHLLAFARRESPRPERIELAAVLEGLGDMLRPAVGARVRVAIRAEPDLPPVLADRQQLEVALLNLAINARDAMPEGGSLAVTAELRPGRDGAPRLAILVRDSGSGMPPEVAARATEPFFTTKPAGKGTGLGLPMVQDFAREAGGELRISSARGEGTEVAILLPPLAVGAAAPASPAEAPASGLPLGPPSGPSLGKHGGATVLVVEDDAAVRPVTAGMLRDLGYTVLEAADAEAALALPLERLDLVVADVMMPGTDGRALAARLRAERPDLPILFVTGQADRAGLASAEAVLDKPFTPATLAASVLERLGRAGPGQPLADRLLARMREPGLRSLYESWLALQAGGTDPPPPSGLPTGPDGAPGNLFVVEVDGGTDPPGLRYASVGAALDRRLGRPLRDLGLLGTGEEVLGTLEGAYRRCLRSRHPAYDYACFALGDDRPVLFERLLIPCSHDGQGITHLIGMVSISDPS